MSQPIVRMHDLTHKETRQWSLGTDGHANKGKLAWFRSADGPVAQHELGTGTSRWFFDATQAGSWSLPEVFLIEFEKTDGDTGSTPAAQQLRFKVYDIQPTSDQTAGPGGTPAIISDRGENFFGSSDPNQRWKIRLAMTNKFIDPQYVSRDNIGLTIGDGTDPQQRLGFATGESDGRAIEPSGLSFDSSYWHDLEWGSDLGTQLDDLILDKYANGSDSPIVGNDGTTPTRNSVGGASGLLVQNAQISPSQQHFWALNYFLYIAIRPQPNAVAGPHRNWGYRLNYVFPGA